MTDPSPSAVPESQPPVTATAPDPPGEDVLASGEPEQIQEAIRASQQRLSEAVDDVAIAVNPIHAAHRSADAAREDPRPLLTVAGAVVAFAILVLLVRRVRRRGRPGTG